MNAETNLEAAVIEPVTMEFKSEVKPEVKFVQDEAAVGTETPETVH